MGVLPVSSTGTQDGVDLNSIPIALVERVEILRDGASALYGSDAVAGVVNFVLKEDFDGLDLGFQGGITDKWDGREGALSVTGGRDFLGGRAHLIFNAAGFDRNKINQKDRHFSRHEIVGFTQDEGGQFLPIFGSSFVPEGKVIGDGNFFRPTADGASFQPATSLGVDQRFDFGRYQYLVGATNNKSLDLLGDYQLGDRAEAYFFTAYNTRDSRQRLAPTPIDDSTGALVDENGVRQVFAIPFQYFPDDYRSAVLGGEVTIPGVDPNELTGETPIRFSRRMFEVGDRIYAQQAKLFRFTGGSPWRQPGDG